MKDFKEFVTEAPKSSAEGSYKSYQDNLKSAIAGLNQIIDYGRAMKMDNKQLNPLLDALKNVHTGDDAIRVAYELSIAPEEKPEDEKKEEKKQW